MARSTRFRSSTTKRPTLLEVSVSSTWPAKTMLPLPEKPSRALKSMVASFVSTFPPLSDRITPPLEFTWAILKTIEPVGLLPVAIVPDPLVGAHQGAVRLLAALALPEALLAEAPPAVRLAEALVVHPVARLAARLAARDLPSVEIALLLAASLREDKEKAFIDLLARNSGKLHPPRRATPNTNHHWPFRGRSECALLQTTSQIFKTRFPINSLNQSEEDHQSFRGRKKKEEDEE